MWVQNPRNLSHPLPGQKQKAESEVEQLGSATGRKISPLSHCTRPKVCISINFLSLHDLALTWIPPDPNSHLSAYPAPFMLASLLFLNVQCTLSCQGLCTCQSHCLKHISTDSLVMFPNRPFLKTENTHPYLCFILITITLAFSLLQNVFAVIIYLSLSPRTRMQTP